MKDIDILLVEDNPGDARLTIEVLKENKIANNLHHVSDGVEALAFLRKQGQYSDAPQPDLNFIRLKYAQDGWP
jgi:CheY-like chemotaxis protein